MPPQIRTVADTIAHEALFFWVFLVIIFSWILIDNWGRVINNLCFETLKLNDKSSYDTFIIALTLTLIIFAMILFLKSLGVNYEKSIGGDEFDDCINEKEFENIYSVPIISPTESLSFFGI